MTRRSSNAPPTSKTAHEKGHELEQAIGSVEKTILAANPNLSEKSYTIEFRKITVFQGVKHEIDVWIEFDLADGYKSVFIFEAKNWNSTVGKDQMAVFSAKISAVNAQTGYFVAKSFSKYAKAAARLDHRISILTAKDDFFISDAIKRFHIAKVNMYDSSAEFVLIMKPDASQPAIQSVDMKTAALTLNGQFVDFAHYARSLVQNLVEENNLKIPTHTLEDGVYTFEIERDVPTQPNILLINSHEVESIRVKLSYPLELIHPRILSKFDIATRGRSYVFEGVSLGTHGTLQNVVIVERDNAPDAFFINYKPN